jgi:hypothetical protein
MLFAVRQDESALPEHRLPDGAFDLPDFSGDSSAHALGQLILRRFSLAEHDTGSDGLRSFLFALNRLARRKELMQPPKLCQLLERHPVVEADNVKAPDSIQVKGNGHSSFNRERRRS